MVKSAQAFRTIGEVSEALDTPAHVLRFWESKFAQVRPVKRAGGRRYYRPEDLDLLCGIKMLLHDRGMTIKGVQKLLREKGVRHVAGEGRNADTAPGTPRRAPPGAAPGGRGCGAPARPRFRSRAGRRNRLAIAPRRRPRPKPGPKLGPNPAGPAGAFACRRFRLPECPRRPDRAAGRPDRAAARADDRCPRRQALISRFFYANRLAPTRHIRH
ncbi:Transcriptional regulator, MerR family [Limimaricola hongkongensis DSM 17492]|uniref:Transcriptional regulator, MerR family n=1 Tax=Limimaricola hongkongensis DSM 17492 TaxID=1122180 RepID=A0A017HHD8_9RHOB|nr:Transcriptional regulator, MerR family [Limimaricola hongkongensis DSM 17492]